VSKYRAIKTDCLHGHTHDSMKEAARCNDLHAMEIAGTLTDLTQQPEFPVSINGQPICLYRADFGYKVQGLTIIEDVKGMQTDVFRLKRKLVEASYPGVVISLYPPPRKRKRRVKKP
jgi:hypothetical protein